MGRSGADGSGWGWTRGCSDEQRAAIREILDRNYGPKRDGLTFSWYIRREPTTINPPWKLTLLQRNPHGRVLQEHNISPDIVDVGRHRP